MQCFGQTIDLADDPALIAAYRAHHRAVWPEVVRGLRACGIRRMQIFLAGTRLFMCFQAPEGFDPARDYQAYAADPRCAEWDLLMRTFQRRIASAAAVPSAGGNPANSAVPAATEPWWTPMELIFDLEAAGAHDHAPNASPPILRPITGL